MTFSTELSDAELYGLTFAAAEAGNDEEPLAYLDRTLHGWILSYQKQAQEKAKSDPKNVALLESILKLDEADRAEVELLLSGKVQV